MILIAGGESKLREAVRLAAEERGAEARPAPRAELPAPAAGDVLVDLGLPPREWPPGPALTDAERVRVTELAGRVPRGGRVVRASWIGAGAEARSSLQRAQHAAEQAWRNSAASAVALRAGILLGDVGLAAGMRRRIERSRIIPLPGTFDVRLEPLAATDFARYCVEAAVAEGPLDDIYDLGCGEILTGGLLAKGLAENLGVTRWVVPVPGFTAAMLAGWYAGPEFPPPAVRAALDAMAGGLLPRRMGAWKTFPVEPADLREGLAAAAGMQYPIRKRSQDRFGNWQAPEQKGILWSKSRRRR